MVLRFIVLLSCSLLVLASDVDDIPVPPITRPPIIPTSTVTPDTSTATTSRSTTSTAPTTSKTPSTTTPSTTTTTSTTSKPITTSATSTTSSTTPSTTPSTSSTTPSTSPTTPATKSTTTDTPTTKPTPKPDDKPSVNQYVGNYTGSSRICLMVKMALQIEIYQGPKSALVNVPKSVNYNVTCPNTYHEALTVSWGTNNTVSFGFFKNNSVYEIQSINTTIQLGPNKTEYYHWKPEFSVSEKLSYYCVKDQPLNLTDGKSNVTLGKIHISHMQYQAFMNTTEAHYDSVWDCDGVNTSDVVPVVVGCVLAVLVVLVLVAYLFGRRRCQARGYLSMFAEERSESDYIPLKTLSCFK